MRTTGIVCAIALLAATGGAAEELRPRPGSGWEGFNAGSWVKIKRTSIPKGRAPMVTVWTTRLMRVRSRTLLLETTAKNALGMEQKSELTVPRSGQAGADEEQEVKRLRDETVSAAGHAFACRRFRTTVTGKEGRRVVTEWEAQDPKLIVKRVTIEYDARGKAQSRFTMTLAGLDEVRRVAPEMVRCLRYKTLRVTPGETQRGFALTSRAMPGNTVLEETEVVRAGDVVLKFRVEALGYRAK